MCVCGNRGRKREINTYNLLALKIHPNKLAIQLKQQTSHLKTKDELNGMNNGGNANATHTIQHNTTDNDGANNNSKFMIIIHDIHCTHTLRTLFHSKHDDSTS